MDYPYNLGSYSRKVTTASADAQRWFDRGLNWCFGYHHEEAVACFEKALETDPNCAMAHWGVAYAVGPNYNYPWELQDPAGKAAALARAHDSARAALTLVGRVTAPTLLLWTDHDPTGGLDEAELLLRWLPDARLHVITDAGHWPQWEKPDEFLRAHHDFLILGKDPA